MRKLILFPFIWALAALGADLEVKSFSALTLKPEAATEQFLFSQQLLQPELKEVRFVVMVRTAIDGKVYSMRSRFKGKQDTEGRWRDDQTVRPEIGDKPIGQLAAWTVTFDELDFRPGANLIQYELFRVSPNDDYISIARTNVYSVTPLPTGYKVDEVPGKEIIPPPPLVVVPKKVDPNFKFRVAPYSSRETETSKVIFFATNRTPRSSPDLAKPWRRFEPLLHEYPEKTTLLGMSVVRVPLGREIGEFVPEAEGLPKERTVGIEDAYELYRVTKEQNPDRQIGRKVEIEANRRKGFFTELKDQPVLVYIHGYNNSFRAALERAAQVKKDLGWKGAMIAYSWPSLGSLPKYFDDLANARDSVPMVAEFLSDLKKNLPGQKINILAHSMGNFLFLKTVDYGVRNGLFKAGDFHRVVLAAPDVSATDFKKFGPEVVKVADAVTYYFSKNDVAVRISSDIRIGLDRAGRDYVAVEGMKAIDASDVSFARQGYGHDYFGTVKAAIADISFFLVDGFGIDQRHGVTLNPMDPLMGTRWRLVTPNL